MIAEKAKEKEHERKTTCQKSDKSYDTKKEVAKLAGVSHDTIHRVETIEASGNRRKPPEEREIVPRASNVTAQIIDNVFICSMRTITRNEKRLQQLFSIS